MRIFLALTLGCTALVGGCLLLVPQINYDLAASVVGAVGREDVRQFAGDRYVDSPSFPSKFSNGQGQVIRVRLSTSKDLVSFANKTGTFVSVKWHLCDIPEKDVVLGDIRAFVDGVEISWIKEKHSSVLPDRQGRFGYDAILYIRGWFMNEETAGIEGRFDLEREPRDVCVRVWLPTKMGGYKTNVVRIPKDEIAAALGVEISTEPPRTDRGRVRQ